MQAVEHVGLAEQGQGGAFWENIYKKYTDEQARTQDPLNINTHGGLMHFGAPGSATSLCMQKITAHHNQQPIISNQQPTTGN